MRRGKSIAMAAFLLILSIEVMDRMVMSDLASNHKSQEYFWDAAINLRDRAQICKGETVSGYTSRSGVDHERYQHRYSYTYFNVDNHVEVHVMGTTPERQWPLWIFSIGIDRFNAIADSSDIYEVYKISISDFCQQEHESAVT